MRTAITARHCEVPADLRQRAAALMERLAKLAHRPQRAEIIFDEDHQRRVVELLLRLPRGQTRVATAEAGDFHTALDRAADKLKRQLDKDAARSVPRKSQRKLTTGG